MTYNREYTGSLKDEDIKLFKVLRSAMQDIMFSVREDNIQIMFPEKIVDGTDIGKVASSWATRIISTCRFYKKKDEIEMDHGKMYRLLVLVWVLYRRGINLDKSDLWHMIWIKQGLPAITAWIESFPASGRVAAADKLEKPDAAKIIEGSEFI